MKNLRGIIIGAIALGVLLAAPRIATAAIPSPVWQSAPVVPRMDGAVKQRLIRAVAFGKKKGMRASVFAKAGDSNTEISTAIYGLGCRRPTYGNFERLAAVVRRYSRIGLENPIGYPDCLSGNSFTRRSAATKSGTWASWPATYGPDLPVHPYWHPPSFCRPQESPLICEIRVTRPRYVFLLTGTNDLGVEIYKGFLPGVRITRNLLPAIGQARRRGVVPVLSTIPPIVASHAEKQPSFDEGVARTNLNIWRLARKKQLPLVNLWRALTGPAMINQGLADDGIHLGVAGADGATPGMHPGPTTFADSVRFDATGLRYGSNRRNLVLLQTLDRLDRALR